MEIIVISRRDQNRQNCVFFGGGAVISAMLIYNSKTLSVILLFIQQFYKRHLLVDINKRQQIMISFI